MTQAARLSARMQKEIKLLLSDPPPGVSFPSLTNESSSPSFESIEARLRGPEGTMYSEGCFTLRIQVPERYPFQPPNITFVTPIYHPNIDSGGRICLDILNLPPKGAWQPSLNISTVLTSIGLLMTEPNPDDGLMVEASREYKYNRKVFDEKARHWTQKYANSATPKNKLDDIHSPNLKMEIKRPLGVVTNYQSGLLAEGMISDKLVEETEASRKKPRLMGGKLALKLATPVSKSNIENKENVPVHQTSWDAAVRFGDGHEKVSSNEALVSPVLNKAVDLNTMIVSDSESSDDEQDMPFRSGSSLLLKRTAWANYTAKRM
ncbi:hypothetical protein HPP92_009498 [Vanilla planifolia]|uniref:E2 ubiquitin-conjugating enzyme n=1 Tax=Vanilla planifolia TaxID=51239 RepID=A0A835V7G9_VANPL|nr:hypothetical protein HPP92_009498 [Vanilla planifolia]